MTVKKPKPKAKSPPKRKPKKKPKNNKKTKTKKDSKLLTSVEKRGKKRTDLLAQLEKEDLPDSRAFQKDEIKRKPNGQFAKGQSGNAGSRSVLDPLFRDACRILAMGSMGHIKDMMEFCIRVKDVDGFMKCWKELAAYGYGKEKSSENQRKLQPLYTKRLPRDETDLGSNDAS